MKKINHKTIQVTIFCFLLLFIGFGWLSVFHTKSALRVAEAMEAIESSLTETGKSFEAGGVMVVLKSSSSKFMGISKELEEKISKIGVESIENLSEMPKEYLNTDGSLSAVTAPTLYEFYQNTPLKQILYIKLSKTDNDSLTNAIYELQNFPEVESVEPNWIYVECSVNSAYSNDPYYSEQWGLKSINAEGAWAYTKGSNSVRVGVIDSGVAKHEDLLRNLSVGYDFVNQNSITYDPRDGHGTHVAGIIAAVNNNATGISGIAPNVVIDPLQTTESEGRIESDEKTRVDAINHAIRSWDTANRISILNHSIGGFGTATSVAAAVNNYPGLFVWSAGNIYKNIDPVENTDEYEDIGKFNLPNLISVGAISSTGERYESSKYGKSVDIYAPGKDIISTFPEEICLKGNCVTNNEEQKHIANGYHALNGTSMAAPFVSGVAALMLSENPNLTGEGLKHCLLEGADTITIDKGSVKKLNAQKSVRLASSSEPIFMFNQDRYLFAVKYSCVVGRGGDRLGMSVDGVNYEVMYAASYSEVVFPEYDATDRMLCKPSYNYYKTYTSAGQAVSSAVTFEEKAGSKVGLKRQRFPEAEYDGKGSGDELPTSHNEDHYWWNHGGKTGQYIIATVGIGTNAVNFKVKIPGILAYNRASFSVTDFEIEMRVGINRVSVKCNKTNVYNGAFHLAFEVVNANDPILHEVFYDNE